jgi:hypothetical protein
MSNRLLFEEWCEHLTQANIASPNVQASGLLVLSVLFNLAIDESASHSGASFEELHQLGSDSQHYTLLISEHHFKLCDIALHLYKSRVSRFQISSMRFLTTCFTSPPLIEELLEQQDDLMSLIKCKDINVSISACSLAHSLAEIDKPFADVIILDEDAISHVVQNLLDAYRHIIESTSELTAPKVIPKISPPPLSSEALSTVLPDPIDPPPASWSEIATGAYHLLACVADIFDAIGVIISHDIIRVSLDLLSLPCPYSLLAAGLAFLAKATAHRKLALEFIDRDGLFVLSTIHYSSCGTLLGGIISSCLHTVCGHFQVPLPPLALYYI